MLSRIADSLFWLNRYMERTDGLLRITATHYILSLDKNINANLSWKPVLEVFTQAKTEEIETLENDTDSVLKKLLIDADNHNSLKVIVHRARENARGVQDHITKEVWEEVNQVYHLINQPAVTDKLNAYDALQVMELFTQRSVMYQGTTDITMPRGSAWNYMSLGKYVERCLETLVMTDKQFAQIDYNITDTKDILQWRNLLLSLSGYELHLKTYRTANYNYNVLHQVLFNQNFTRSVLYSLTRVHRYLQAVVFENNAAENDALLKCFGRLYSKVRYADIDTLTNETLKIFIAETKADLLDFSRRLSQSFFSYS